MRRKFLRFTLFLVILSFTTSGAFAKWEGCESLPWYYFLQLWWYGGFIRSSDALKKVALINEKCCDCSLPWLKALKPELTFTAVAMSVHFEQVHVGGKETYSRILAEFDDIDVENGEPLTTSTLTVESNIGPCNSVFEVGKRYQVIVANRSIGQPQTNNCLGTRLIEK